MLFRLILALLVAMLAVPGAAPAACHDAPAGAQHAMAIDMAMPHHPAPHDAADAVHGCIGCIPPSDWLRAPAIAPVAAARPVLVARVTMLDIGGGAPPALPPPRRG